MSSFIFQSYEKSNSSIRELLSAQGIAHITIQPEFLIQAYPGPNSNRVQANDEDGLVQPTILTLSEATKANSLAKCNLMCCKKESEAAADATKRHSLLRDE
jgi:hypothetical protein